MPEDLKPQAVDVSEWDLESGLVDDVDGWIANEKFGVKEEYAKKVAEASPDAGPAIMFLADLLNEDGEKIASQGWSVGTGWIPSEDGQSIAHPTRKNVVDSSLYGQLQKRTVKELGVNMAKYGKPTQARSWHGLGFHWKLQPHKVFTGEDKPGLMPTEFLGEMTVTAAVPAGTVAKNVELEKQLTEMAQKMAVKAFQKAAIRVPEVSKDDDLIAAILDDSDKGYWSSKQKKA